MLKKWPYKFYVTVHFISTNICTQQGLQRTLCELCI
jgi:hypothetical protein